MHAVAFGCMVSGIAGPPPFAEVQVFVKWSADKPGWDYRPIVARYPAEQGGAPRAAQECADWNKRVGKQLKEAAHEPAKAR